MAQRQTQQRQVVTFKMLLNMAHQKGVQSIVTTPVTVSEKFAFFKTHITMKDGTEYTGHADATPANVGPGIAPSFIRMAETRSIVRALRLAVNIGDVAAEEMGDYDHQQSAAPTQSRAAVNENDPITAQQMEAIKNLCKRHRLDPHAEAKAEFEVGLESLTQGQASSLIRDLNKQPVAA